MRTKEEIENKINEIYDLLHKNKINMVKAILSADALAWVLGDDYLDTENIDEDLDAETND